MKIVWKASFKKIKQVLTEKRHKNWKNFRDFLWDRLSIFLGQIWVCWILICHKCFTFVTVYPIWITVTPLYSKNKTYDTNILLEIRLECVLESNTKIIKYMRGVSLELIHLNKNYLNHNSLMKVPEVRLLFWIFSSSLYKNKIKKTILSVTKIEILLEIIYKNIITYINKIIYMPKN